jgi:Uma2 family endonuclease
MIGTNPATAGGRGYTEVGYDFPDALSDNHRVPDLSFFKAGRPRPMSPYPKDMPDLAVEIRSPGQSVKGQRERLAFLREKGVPCTLMIDPETQTIHVNEDGSEWIARSGDTVTLTTLDGFSFAVDDVFAES